MQTARLEAQANGIEFGPTQVEVVYGMEEDALDSWQRRRHFDASALAARKRWKAIIEKDYDQGTWSKGKEYVRLWKEGVRPDYLPVLKEPVMTDAGVVPGDSPAAAAAMAEEAVNHIVEDHQRTERTGRRGDFLRLLH